MKILLLLTKIGYWDGFRMRQSDRNETGVRMGQGLICNLKHFETTSQQEMEMIPDEMKWRSWQNK